MVSRESAIFSRPVNLPRVARILAGCGFHMGMTEKLPRCVPFLFSFSIFLFSFFPSGVIVSLRREILLILKNENYHFLLSCTLDICMIHFFKNMVQR